MFMCPFVRSVFKSKSYTAYKLRKGMNYTNFLGLRDMESSRRSLVLPGDIDEVAALKDHFEKYGGPKSRVRGPCALPKEIEYTPSPVTLPIHVYKPPTHYEGGDDSDRYQSQGQSSEKDLTEIVEGTNGNDVRGSMYYPNPTQVDDDVKTTQLINDEADTGKTTQRANQGNPPTLGGKRKDTGDDRFIDYPNLERDEPPPEGKRIRKKVQHFNPDLDGLNDTGRKASEGLQFTAQGVRDKIAYMTTLVSDYVAAFAAKPLLGEVCEERLYPTVPEPEPKALADWDEQMFSHRPLLDGIGWDQDELTQTKHESIVSEDGDTLPIILRKFQPPIPDDYANIYREWVVHHSPGCSSWTEDMIPVGTGAYLSGGLIMPRPTGRNWQCLVEEHASGGCDDNDPLIRQAMSVTCNWVRSLKNVKACNVKKKRTKAIESGLKACPKTIDRAWRSDDGEEWVTASDLEMDTLTEMGVFDHGYSERQLKELKICDFKDTYPINISVALDNKYTDGVLSRRKVRMAVAGHKYNLTKGVHYDEVFAAAPNQNTMRVMQAMMVDMKMFRKAWDIKLAYCHAPLPKGQHIALKYPKGYERYGPDGEPLYIVLRRNCYGVPSAGRAWAQHRDEYMLSRFNTDGWTCKRSTYDPCLFYITRETFRPDAQQHGCDTHLGVATCDLASTQHCPNTKVTRECRPAHEEAWVLIHTDDCDAIGTSKKILKDIYDIHNAKWSAKDVQPDFFLGIKRNVTHENGNMICENTMTAFVDGMVDAFKEHLPDTHPPTPFPPNLYLYKFDKEESDPDDEVELKEYQRAVGMLLWAQRGVFPECAVGLHQLCRVMAKPSRKAWKSAMYMIAWMRANRTRGIQFSTKGNDDPIVFSDASFNPDPNDGLSQYGWVTMWKGGPIASCSKKLAHVGMSAFHNEYMALRHGACDAMWIRNLLNDIGIYHPIVERTTIYGDNQAANQLTKEDFVSTGNKYLYLPYHYVKELYAGGHVEVLYKNTKLNFADLFTKPVTREVIKTLIRKLCGYDTDW